MKNLKTGNYIRFLANFNKSITVFLDHVDKNRYLDFDFNSFKMEIEDYLLALDQLFVNYPDLKKYDIDKSVALELKKIYWMYLRIDIVMYFAKMFFHSFRFLMFKSNKREKDFCEKLRTIYQKNNSIIEILSNEKLK